MQGTCKPCTPNCNPGKLGSKDLQACSESALHVGTCRGAAPGEPQQPGGLARMLSNMSVGGDSSCASGPPFSPFSEAASEATPRAGAPDEDARTCSQARRGRMLSMLVSGGHLRCSSLEHEQYELLGAGLSSCAFPCHSVRHQPL